MCETRVKTIQPSDLSHDPHPNRQPLPKKKLLRYQPYGTKP